MLVPVSPSGTGYTFSRLSPPACSRTVSRKVVMTSRSARVSSRSRVGTADIVTAAYSGGMSTRVVNTACTLDCPDACSLAVTVEGAPGDERIVTDRRCSRQSAHRRVDLLEGQAPRPARLRPRTRAHPADAGRARRATGEFREATWDEAMTTIADRMREAIDRSGRESVVAFTYNSSAAVDRARQPHRSVLRRDRGDRRRPHDLCGDGGRRMGERVRRHGVGRPARCRQQRPDRDLGRQPDGLQHALPAARPAGGGTRRQAGRDRSASHGDGETGRSAPGDPARHRCRAGDGDRRRMGRQRTPRSATSSTPMPMRRRSSSAQPATGRSTGPPRCAGSRPTTFGPWPNGGAAPGRSMLRIGWGQERNSNGGAACRAILALPVLAGHFGEPGAGVIGSTSPGAVRTRRRWPAFARLDRRSLPLHQIGEWMRPDRPIRVACCSSRGPTRR